LLVTDISFLSVINVPGSFRMPYHFSRFTLLALATIGSLLPWQGLATEPLHVRIDALIQAKAADTVPQPLAEDAEFVRRVYLDLAGRIPTVREAEEFVGQQGEDKRAQLIHRLSTSPDYHGICRNCFMRC